MERHGGVLTPQERWRFILRTLESDASVSTLRLSRHLGVSGETIRRDLIALEDRDLLRRTYGGATAPEAKRTSEPSFSQRSSIHAEAKMALARCAVDLVGTTGSIFLDVGTTAATTAAALAPVFRGTVTTASLLAAEAISAAGNCELIVAPGRLRRGEWSLTGSATHDFLRRIHFDVALVSCGGVDASVGATDFDFEDVQVKRTVAAHSRTAYVLADSSKHGVVGSHEIGPWHDLGGLITDTEPPPGLSAAVRRTGGRVLTPAAL